MQFISLIHIESLKTANMNDTAQDRMDAVHVDVPANAVKPSKAVKGCKGGKRIGSGRPKANEQDKRVQCGFVRLPSWMAEWLRQQGNCGKLVEDALMKQYALKRPDGQGKD